MSETRVIFLGHAGFIVEHRGRRLLIDPWFYPAFLESWFPFPDNRAQLDLVYEAPFDALFVSHTHSDHFDRRVLERLDPSTPVLCARFRSRELLKSLRDVGFTEINVLAHDESFDIGDGFRATMVMDQSHKEDSGLLLDLDGFTFLNLNDCHPKLSDLPAQVDLLAAQFSGAMWYPNCYDYDGETMASKVRDVRAGLFSTLTGTVSRLGARSFIPCAGPPVFLDPVLAQFNEREETIFPTWDDLAAEFGAELPDVEVITLEPGEQLAIDASGLSVAPSVALLPETTEEYRERRREEWASFDDRPATTVTTEELNDYFVHLIRRNRRLLEEFERDIRIDADDCSWLVQIRSNVSDDPTAGDSPTVRELGVDADDRSSYSFSMPMRALRAIVDGDATWEDALLSLRVRLSRSPDLFDATLMGLLRYGSTPAITTQLRRDSTVSSEMIARCGHVFQRFCPHAGEDLSDATIHDGVVECPRHHWAWDLTTGACVRGGTYPLQVASEVPD